MKRIVKNNKQKYHRSRSMSWMIDIVSEETGINKDDVKDIVRSLFDNIVREVAVGHTVNFTNFGTFKPTDRAGYTGHNPSTLQSIWISPARLIKFFASERAASLVASQTDEDENGSLITTDKLSKGAKTFK